MQKKKCLICIKAQRRYGKLDFSTTHEKFPNQSLTLGCQCNCMPIHSFDDENSIFNHDKRNSVNTRHTCSFCSESFTTVIKLFYHTNKEHTMDNTQDDWDFYSAVGNTIIGNLDYFYYDKDKLYKLSSLIDALQTNVVRIKRLTPIEE